MKFGHKYLSGLSFAACAFMATTAAFGGQRVVCYASGESLAQQGRHMMGVSANFEFTVTEDSRGMRALKDFKGEVITDPGHVEYDRSWIGRFDIAKLVENPDYRPRKYQGFSQFREVDATDTGGSAESGMWGVFLLEKDISGDHIQAKYIFQAGDHMGGTLHLGCHHVG